MSSLIKSKNEQTIGKCKVYLVHVQVNDVQGKIQEVFDNIRNTSWIERLGNPNAQLKYSIASERTIKKLTEEIFNGGNSPLTEETGEYVISVSAVTVLSEEYGHKKVAISELWKEQKSGNPGFDFHSVNPDSVVIFGEAKYKSNPPSPHGTAFNQINDLISEKKDAMDLVDLEQIIGIFPTERFRNGFKGYSAAFSLNAKSPETVMSNALTSTLAKPLLEYSELYIIGMEFAS
ncbi:MAG: hypothetical protein ACTHOO_10665 [Alcanivorax sp.]